MLINFMMSSFQPFKLTLLLSLFTLFSFSLLGQQNDIGLADEYYANQEYEKAITIYNKLIRKDENVAKVHKNYLDALYKTDALTDAEKYLKKLLKRYPVNAAYNIDYGKLLQYEGDSITAINHFDDYLNTIKDNDSNLRYAALYFKDEKLYEYSEKAFLMARKIGEDFYYEELAELYMVWGKVDEMLSQYMEILLKAPEQSEYVQAAIQDNIAEDDIELLEKKLYKYVQKHPDKIVFNEMLIWYLLQKKDFYRAFLQAKAVDKRKNMKGRKVMSIGHLALNNKAYKDAIKIFEYAVKTYQRNPDQYSRARRLLITAKAELVKNTYPVDLEKIQSLANDYGQMISESGLNMETAESTKNMALLYAFYLNNRDTAVTILQSLIERPGIPRNITSESKLALGDIFILKEESWESTLLYSQVEKAHKDQNLGHIAKLKNAKLHYYNGDFELSKSHLDILKLATSREIANDAMDLSLLIEDNLNLDTSDVAMKTYANIDLLVFQGVYDKALAQYDQMLANFKDHSLTDEILWEKALLLEKLGKFEDAVRSLEKLLLSFSDDILGDDANFMLGRLYEDNLNNKEKAMEYYKKQLTEFRGSVHNVEARKRFRLLRGDDLN